MTAPASHDGEPLTLSACAVICCYTTDRWHAVLAAVASVQAQSVAVEPLVVVDHHPELERRLREALPGVRVIASTGTPGLSGARNTGVGATDADVVLFLDDDAVADPRWAEHLLACFTDQAVAVVGGGVEPDWAGGVAPAWFPAEFGWVVGCGYRGQPPGRAAVRNPIGASMAVRRSVFDLVGGFSDALGRVGTLPVGCEETELCLRLAAHDPEAVVLLEPDSRVFHHVPRQRQRVRYVVRRCYHEGRSKAAVASLSAQARPADAARGLGATAAGSSLRTEADYATRVLPRAVVRHAGAALRGSAADALAVVTLVAGLGAAVLGYLVQGRLLRKQATATILREQATTTR